MPRSWRRTRTDGDDAEKNDDDSVRLDDQEHLWWAGSDEAPHAEPVEPVGPDTREEEAAWSRQPPLTPEELREAFRKKRRRNDQEQPGPRGTFEDYYSADSLFTSVSDAPLSDDADLFDPTDPYAVLGVAMSSTWEQITFAHRRLAKLHHPDRLLHSTDDERRASEERMRDINIAYAELKRRRGR